jgi:hypothetical protein
VLDSDGEDSDELDIEEQHPGGSAKSQSAGVLGGVSEQSFGVHGTSLNNR